MYRHVTPTNHQTLIDAMLPTNMIYTCNDSTWFVSHKTHSNWVIMYN